jgi:hypothetical protein
MRNRFNSASFLNSADKTVYITLPELVKMLIKTNPLLKAPLHIQQHIL